MIAGLSGTLAAKDGDRITIATAGGVLYDVSVPLGVLEQLPPVGQRVELQTVPIVREDGWALYGFNTERERVIFQKLLGASGIGPRLALAILSTLGPDRVIHAIRHTEIGLLCTVQGVGRKTAEKMIVELKDRVKDLEVGVPSDPGSRTVDQAVRALVNLGYSTGDADRAVRTTVARDGVGKLADLIRQALQGITDTR